MRATIRILSLSLIVFVTALVLRRAFFADVRPVSWDYTPPSDSALEAAFLLLSVQNVAAVTAGLAFAFTCALWLRRWRRHHSRLAG
jgi:hypothetical protein